MIIGSFCFAEFAYGNTGHSTKDHDHNHDHDHDHSSPAHHKFTDEDNCKQFDPELSIVGNFLTEFSDNKGNPNRGRFRVREAEATFQTFLLPWFRLNAIGSMEQEYHDSHVNTDFHLEELYGSFFLPNDVKAVIGRQLVGFGALNPTHYHERPFADIPLALANFFGEHSWYDDGVSLSMPIGSLSGAPIRNSFSYLRGRNFGLEHIHEHGHEEEEEEHHEGHGPIKWGGNVYLNRISSEIELDHDSHIDLGYSVAWDEGGDNILHGLDMTYRNTDFSSFDELIWQSELFYADVDTSDTEPLGFYSMLQFVLDDKWDIGGRYDWSEAPGEGSKYEWAISPFVTYHIDESMFCRLQYRYREMIENHETENTLFMQFVWEIGTHSH